MTGQPTPDRTPVETVAFETIDGVILVGERIGPDAAGGPVRGAAVVCHPHPLYGGDMRSMVVEAVWRAFARVGFVAVRFDFRGAGGSGGEHGGGTAERMDVAAAIESVAHIAEAANGPLVLAGYSFGADIATTVTDPRLDGWFLVAPPLRVVDPADMTAGRDHRPKLLAVPEHDQFNPPDAARERTAAWQHASVAVIPGGDHFLAGRTAVVADLAAAFATELLAAR